MVYLTNTFSPAMLAGDGPAHVEEISLSDARYWLSRGNFVSAVGHEVTASVLTALLGIPVSFNRVNLALVHGDRVVCVVPNFRANEAREFSREEVEAAGFRCFLVKIW